jgi:lysozyme
MALPRNVVELVTLHEGVRRFPYRDTVGKLTIGVGFNLDDVGLYPEEIEFILANRLIRKGEELERAIPWIKELDEVRQAVLLDMAFNLGVAGLLGFKNTLRLVSEKRYKEASKNMLQSKWAGQVKGRAIRLSKMMETGQWPVS